MRRFDRSYRLPVQESPDLADTSIRRPETVSATVYLEPRALERIKEVCRDENRRISDVISEAVDSYLRERTKLAFEDSTGWDRE
jgi:hypothetical protein